MAALADFKAQCLSRALTHSVALHMPVLPPKYIPAHGKQTVQKSLRECLATSKPHHRPFLAQEDTSKKGHKEGSRNQSPAACTADTVADDGSGKEPRPHHVFLQQSLPSSAQQGEAEVEAEGRASSQPAQHPAVTSSPAGSAPSPVTCRSLFCLNVFTNRKGKGTWNQYSCSKHFNEAGCIISSDLLTSSEWKGVKFAFNHPLLLE